MAKIFVPKTCRVGFQERSDTFTKKLAYVIYYDAKGQLRKETSWEQWRHKPTDKVYDSKEREDRELRVDVTPYDFENVPTSGFVLNKGHTRYSWSHFGGRRTVIRIYDPRGIEFEITPENLVGLLMHTDCSHREVQGELVYAWCGTELMLLPCSSEEYQSAVNYSSLQGTRISAKDLKEGYTYITKNEVQLIYIGRHMWYEATHPYHEENKRFGKKHHIFFDPAKKEFGPVKSVSSTIAKCLSDSFHDDYANLVDEYLQSDRSSPIVEWTRVPIPDELWDRNWSELRYPDNVLYAVTEENGELVTVQITLHTEAGRYDWKTNKHVVDYAGPPRLEFSRRYLVCADGSMRYIRHDYRRHSNFINDRTKFFFLHAVYGNGLNKKWGDDG